MSPARIAAVRYLNTSPLIEGLNKVEGLSLIPTVPARIADLLVSGEADIGLASIVDSVAAEKPLALLPCGMIGCDGPTLTVRLFSAQPLEKITELHADADSHTSTILAQVLLNKLYGLRPRMVEFDARERVATAGPGRETSLEESWPSAVVLIGDKVITDPPPVDRYPHQLDLGEAWKQLTGLPFVYAMWMCRAEEVGNDSIRHAAVLLDRQLRHNMTRIEWVISTRAHEARWPVETARRYLSELLRFRVGPREKQAVERFLADAAELKLLPRRSVVWAWSP
ncbi:MAG: hypothetical protein JSR77_14790 [Planctomycetes bacterium]|nr:hypothetical protein [Planctomycetota bacterium]